MSLELYHPNEDGVVVYRTEDNTLQLDVQLAEETVWLAQQQIAVLFDTTKQNVSLHINNIFKEGELDKISVIKDYLTTDKLVTICDWFLWECYRKLRQLPQFVPF